MKTVKLADGTLIENCLDYSNPTEIVVLRDNYTEAGEVADQITPERMRHLVIYNDDGSTAYEAHNLIYVKVDLNAYGDRIELTISSRMKSELEDLKEQIAELQVVVIGG